MKERKFRNNKEKKRYELELGEGYIALIDYFIYPNGDIALTHTEVPYEFEGRGIGKELVLHCLNDIKDQGVCVVPRCGFVASYIRKNPEWQDLLPK